MNQRFIGFYDRITPESSSEEFKDTIMRKAENMKKTQNNTVRRPKNKLLIAAAAAVLTVGVGTAAFASGLIDFNRVFGNVITAENSAGAEQLVSGAEDFRYHVSDEDYIVIPKGVTGTEKSVVAAFEIARKDGAPFTDYLLYQPEETRLWSTFHSSADLDDIRSYSSGTDAFDISINENGNLSVIANYTASTDLTGRTIRIRCADLYEYMDLLYFVEENNVHNWFTEDIHATDSCTPCDAEFFTDGYNAVFTDTSDIVLHELDWIVEFVYSPSAAAASCLTADDISAGFTETAFIDNNERLELPCIVKRIDVNAIGVTLVYKWDMSAAPNISESELTSALDMDVQLITHDGERISTQFTFGSGEPDENGSYNNLVSMNIVDDNNNRIAVDLNDIAAISINDVEYTLS